MEIMERPTDNIKNPKIRTYMENFTEGKPNVEKISGASFSYIAKKYFGKSRGWLMQKT